MWVKIASLIIKNRAWLLAATIFFTVFMGYQARKVQMTYDFVTVVPEGDSTFINFKEFQKTFGEDGNILAIGLEGNSILEYENFKLLKELTQNIEGVEGVSSVIALPTVKTLKKDTLSKRFVMENIIPADLKAEEYDSLINSAVNAKFYDKLLYNKNSNATILAVTIERSYLNSDRRADLVNKITGYVDGYSEKTKVTAHYAGLPYIRSIMVTKVRDEFKLFLVLAAVVTSLFLFVFFRSFFAVAFTFLVILITVCWTLGFLVVFGYKITLLTGILPALIIIISIPNCIYMFNKYHHEYKKHGNKVKGISRIIEKIGFLTFMTNANTAVGFFVLVTADITIIKEFGMIAGIISIATFLITLIVIPSLLLYLPAPNTKQLKHLDLKFLRKINIFLEHVVMNRRKVIYIVTSLFLFVGLVGLSKIKEVSYMVDDLPEKSNVKSDLQFFEQHFKGIMPLEIVVDLGKPKGFTKLQNLQKLEELEDYLKTQEHISPPVSILSLVKSGTQAFYNGAPEQYRLPTQREAPFITKYFGGKSGDEKNVLKSFVDSTGRYVRFSCKVADLGTTKMEEEIVKKIKAKTNEIFAGTDMKAEVTGTTVMFLAGNKYLINDLTESLIMAFILISLMMAMIFFNLRMIIISLIPNIIPMVLTAGIMGLFNIPLKPSTALIFSISFGISIDSTIHYLSKFKQELKILNGNIYQAVLKTLEEVGVSMIYTSLVLFGGFVIFSFSEFGGTIALGVLTSITLFFAMLTNLILLPTLLITFGGKGKEAKLPVIFNRFRKQKHPNKEEVNIDTIAANQ
ncbi:MAG: efflux RND transporter permease subunit [Cytophagaceae bacterium]